MYSQVNDDWSKCLLAFSLNCDFSFNFLELIIWKIKAHFFSVSFKSVMTKLIPLGSLFEYFITKWWSILSCLLECFYSPVHSALLFDMTWIKNDQKVQQGQNKKSYINRGKKYLKSWWYYCLNSFSAMEIVFWVIQSHVMMFGLHKYNLVKQSKYFFL